MRPVDLAREHGLSTQAVRNYERDGVLPPAGRTASGYRVYTDVHAAALRAFLAMVGPYGHATAGQIMRALHGGALDDALTAIDQAHDQLARDRATLDAVRAALAARPGHVTGPGLTGRTIGELARRLGVTPATVRAWERAGVLTPGRDPATGYRVFDAGDTRDADLAHLLRRGGYRLDRIATVVRQVRAAGGTPDLARAVADWQRRLTARGLGMLDAAAALSRYLRLAPAYDGSPAGRT